MDTVITASIKKQLDAWFAASADQQTDGAFTEIEARVTRAVDKQTFSKAMKWLMAKGWKLASLPETLDIITQNNLRTSIMHPNDIAKFSNKPEAIKSMDVTVMEKKRNEPPIDLAAIGVRINNKTEAAVNDNTRNAHFQQLSQLNKTFRLKKRFTLTNAEQYRADFTIVKSNSNVRRLPVSDATYEVELEALPGATAQAFLEGLTTLLRALDDGFEPMSKHQKDAVVSKYLSLTFPKVSLSVAYASPKQHFAAPMPVTLMLNNVLPAEPGRVSIMEDYTVTDKADGERALLFCHDNRAYLINSRLDVRTLPVKSTPDVSNSLLDGEWIALDGRKHLFAVFDAYMVASRDVRALPLQASNPESKDRLSHAANVIKALSVEDENISIAVKHFDSGNGNEIFSAAARTLRAHKAGNMPYDIDGLIFTPKSLGVGATPSTPAGTALPWSGTWPMTLKWKPPEENTIDFLVKFQQKDAYVVKDDKRYRVAHLHVGFNSASEPKTAFATLGSSGGDRKSSAQGQRYVAKLFQPEGNDGVNVYEAFLPVNDAGVSTCIKDGEPIVSDTVIEFAYAGKLNEDAFSSYKWVPMRIRVDKTQEYRLTKRVSANNYKVALNVWESIINPVTEEIITGRTRVKNDIASQDVYYAKIGGRDISITRRLRTFHNYWVKLHTCLLPFSGAKSLLDLACGKGGDLRKWTDAGFVDVVGLDLFADNITNAEDGAYARLARAKLPSDARYAFVPYDVSKPIDAARINRLEDDGDRMVMQALWAVVPRQMIRSKGLLRYYGMASQGFDVISCQFAIHYFLKDEATLDVFIANVSRNLKPGGSFVATCMDGKKLKQRLAKVSKGGDVSGSGENGELVWSIRKMYEETDVQDDVIPAGLAIAVYLESIDTTNVEYLVDYEYLKTKFANAGLVPKVQESFEALYGRMLQHEATSASEHMIKEAAAMTAVEKELSFMNMWFAFEKPKKPASSAKKA